MIMKSTPVHQHFLYIYIPFNELPFCGRVLRVDWIFEFNNVPIPLLQLTHVLHIILHEFSERGKLLTSIQIVEVSSILYLNVSNFPIPSIIPNQKHCTYHITKPETLYSPCNTTIIILLII